jgi:hypothetical protein
MVVNELKKIHIFGICMLHFFLYKCLFIEIENLNLITNLAYS